MTRICIICEGPTEVAFVNTCLGPYLWERSGVEVYGTILNSPSGNHPGGRVTVDRLARCIALCYHQADYISTLVDFYGFQDRNGRTRTQIEQAISAKAQTNIKDYDARRVLPYVQMHEFEALLFSNPQGFEWVLDGWNEDVKAKLESVVASFENPERINDSPLTAPSKRILDIFQRNYSKTLHGPLIAEEIGIDIIRAKCPGFNEWIKKMMTWGS